MRSYFLKTDRIGFSTWSFTDIDLAESLWGDSMVTKFICASGIFTKEEIITRLETEIRNAEKNEVQYWPIFTLDTNELIGCCGLRPRKEKEYEIGFHLRPQFWRQGYAKLGFAYIGDEYYKPTGLYHPSYELNKDNLL